MRLLLGLIISLFFVTTSFAADVPIGAISDNLSLNGVIEVEASYTDPETGNAESDIVLATAELTLEAALSDHIGGHVMMLYEEGEDFTVDEAVISLTCSQKMAGAFTTLHAGKLYLPFGMFNSYMVSDPLTLELGETGDTALLFEVAGKVLNLKLGFFNGDADAAGDKNHADDYVVSLEITPIEGVAFGASYISDLAESDGGLVSEDDLTPALPTSLYTETVAGASAFLSLQFGQFGLEAEYLGALDTFDTASLVTATDLTGEEPEAYNVELAWMPSDDLQIAARYEEATDFKNDMKRYGVAVGYGLFDNVAVAFEYLNSEEDLNPGSEADTFTAQLALEF